MHREQNSVGAHKELPEALCGISLENRHAVLRRMDSDQIKNRPLALGLILRRRFRPCRKGAVGLGPFIDISLHVAERSVSFNDAVQFHAPASPRGYIQRRVIQRNPAANRSDKAPMPSSMSNVGVRFFGCTWGSEKKTNTISSVTTVTIKLMTTLLVKEMPKELSATPTSTTPPAAR